MTNNSWVKNVKLYENLQLHPVFLRIKHSFGDNNTDEVWPVEVNLTTPFSGLSTFIATKWQKRPLLKFSVKRTTKARLRHGSLCDI